MPLHGMRKCLKYLYAVTQSIILICKFCHVTWTCLGMYKAVSMDSPGWEPQEAEPQGYRRETGFQWAAGYSSKGVWGSAPEFYIAFKTQIFHQHTLRKPLTGSMPIYGCGLMIMSSPRMAGTNGYISVDRLSSGSVLQSEPKAPVSQEILLPSQLCLF